MRLLMVEADGGAATIILRANGFRLDHFSTVTDAHDAVRDKDYRAILIAEKLPDGDGITWLRNQRAAGMETPVMVLTASARAEARIRAFEAGADDSVPLPFDGRELVARVRAVLRRPPTIADSPIVSGNIRLEPAGREMWVGDSRTSVPRREFDLLEVLARRTGRVIARSTLENLLYGHIQTVSPNSLDVCVSRLRRYLIEANADRRIDTVRGTGYILVPCESAVASDADHSSNDRSDQQLFDRFQAII